MTAMILAELSMLVMLATRVRKARRAWRKARLTGAPALEALISALVAARFPPRLASIAGTVLTADVSRRDLTVDRSRPQAA